MAFQKSAQSLGARLHVGARTPLIAGVSAVAALVLAAAGFAWAQGGGGGFSLEKADASEVSQPAEAASAGGEAQAAGQGGGEEAAGNGVCVHVSGAVAAPGVYRLPSGARVADAVQAAGGFSEGAAPDALNLARLLNDGEQVAVPTPEEAQQAAASGASDAAAGAAGAAPSGKVNLNSAGVAELDTLPGIGPATAQRIVADRESNGPFASVDDLKRVSGIGDKKFEQLASLVCVG